MSSGSQGFLKLRSGLREHINGQQFTPIDAGVYLFLHLNKNWKTSICWTNCQSIASVYRTTRSSINDSFHRLQQQGYIDYPPGNGSRNNYPVLLINDEPTRGPLKGMRLVGFDADWTLNQRSPDGQKTRKSLLNFDIAGIIYSFSNAEPTEAQRKAVAHRTVTGRWAVRSADGDRTLTVPFQDIQDFKINKMLPDLPEVEDVQDRQDTPLGESMGVEITDFEENQYQSRVGSFEEEPMPPTDSKRAAKRFFELLTDKQSSRLGAIDRHKELNNEENYSRWPIIMADCMGEGEMSLEEFTEFLRFATNINDRSAEYLRLARDPASSLKKNFPNLLRRFRAFQKALAAKASREALLGSGRAKRQDASPEKEQVEL